MNIITRAFNSEVVVLFRNSLEKPLKVFYCRPCSMARFYNQQKDGEDKSVSTTPPLSSQQSNSLTKARSVQRILVYFNDLNINDT